MMKRLVLAMLAVVALSLMAVNGPSLAQAAKEIAYGDTAPGEFTDSVRSVSYEFKGAKGDIAVVEMLPGMDKIAYGANISVEDANKKSLADSSQLIIFGQLGEIVAAELPADGTYTITVFLDKTSTDVGVFDLMLVKAEVLEVGKTVKGEAQSATKDKRSSYAAAYTFSSKDNVLVTYSKDKGDYMPSVIVYAVEGANSLYPLNYMGGRGLNMGALGVDGDRNFRVVVVGDLGFAETGTDDSAKSASFTLGLEVAK